MVRREFDPEPVALPPGGLEIISHLLAGASVLEACERASAECGEVRLDETLTILVRFGAIAAIAGAAEVRGKRNSEPAVGGAVNNS